jgi:DNA-directed RNA polymerase II subunit RPB2
MNEMKDVSWKILDTYFKDNPYNLVAHHLDSYNKFFNNGIFKIFKENNPIRFLEEIEDKKTKNAKSPNECLIYLGGVNGDKIYFGKPIINDVESKNKTFMYPNNARLRNMSYCVSIHYDVDIHYIYYDDDDTKIDKTITLPKIYLGKFPIMLHSDLCVLKGLSVEARYNLGECNNDYGGYFIIDGKEKVIISQEKFANNMLYIREYGGDDKYSHSAEIKSVSEDTSKPIRTTSVKIVAPNKYSNNQIVVDIPNVRKPIPLFILMRALGVDSDKSIIEHCLLDLDQNSRYIDLFIPSIHDANRVFTQSMALEYIATFTKRQTVTSVLEILMNYFLAHVGVTNFLDKAYFIGYMVYKLLRVFTKEEHPTDRDNFMFKRIELSGTLIYDLFREYYLTQRRDIELTVDRKYYTEIKYTKSFDEFTTLVDTSVFKNLIVESGFKKGFKGNWGSLDYTKRIGLVQDLNRLSWYSFITHLRKINLNIDSTSKTIKPRLLNNSQYGYIDILDSPDGGNIGYHKHLAISASVTTNFSTSELINWIRKIIDIKLLSECYPKYLYSNTKIIINGNWIGVVENPIETVKQIRLFRRNGFISNYINSHHISISFNYENNIIYIYSDEGRLTRPIYYIDHSSRGDVIPSYHRHIQNLHKYSWSQLIHGFLKVDELTTKEDLKQNKSILDYVDVLEENSSLIAMNYPQLNDKNNKYYTHLEIDPSLMLGVLGNSVIYPEHNQLPRNVFSCGQSRQAVSLYHSNYQVRLDKTAVVLNCGQIPLVKSRYLEYINKEQHPYGVNAIVAIMCYTGYNMEDAILINQGSVDRGIFRTSYYSTYESTEEVETDSKGNHISSSQFSNFETKNVILTKLGHKYDKLDKYGLVVENTEVTDETALIGKIKTTDDLDVYTDESVFAKKGQLGYVDKSFITETDNGVKLAKIRIREERIPAIGDKMASRAGQKGTIGLIIPEQDMPYTEDGIRPDIIINPHALPSRMTIAQLVETTLGKIGAFYGAFGDSTAFSVNGPNHEVYGSMLVEAGFHSSGNQILYNGMNGQQIISNIFIGPTYYMRLKHMVKDKINYRARGPRTMLTRQSVQGRANDGGLRIGEMERDAIMANGMTHFLTDTFLKQGDEYYMAVCNKTGMISIYNPNMNLFMSPSADGPLQYTEAIDGKHIVNNITRFGRSFSVVRVPYSFKLLMQELQVINVQMRIITDENVEQMMNMSYSKNINKLLKMDDEAELGKMIDTYITSTTAKQTYQSFVTALVPDTVQENFINPIIETIGEIGETENTGNTGNTEEIGKGIEFKLNIGETVQLEPEVSIETNVQPPTPPSEESTQQISYENPNNFGNPDLNMIYAKLTPQERSHLEGLNKEDTINVLKELLDKQNELKSILQVKEEKEVAVEEKEAEKTDTGTKKINISMPPE